MRVKPPLGSLLDWSHPHARGLTSVFALREGSGAAVLDATGRPAGSLVGSPVWAPGADGPAVVLNGSSQYLETGRVAGQVVSATSGTIEVLFRKTAASQTSDSPYQITSLCIDRGGYLGLSIGIIGGADRVWAYNFSSVAQSVGGVYSADGWNRATWVHGGGVLSCYVNGVLGGSTSSGDTGSVGSPLRFGLGYSDGFYFGGLLGSCLTWDRALSSDEVAARHADPWGLFQAPSTRRFFVPTGGGASPQTVTPSGIPSAEAFGAPTITAGPVTLSPSGITSAEAIGSPTLTPGPVTLSPSGIPTAEAFGTPSLTATAPGAVTISPAGIGSAETLGSPTITPGAVVLSIVGIPSAEAVGTPTVSTGSAVVVIAPSGIPSAESLGTPTITPGPITISPLGIASREAFGLLVITGGLETLADDLLTAIQDAFLASIYADLIPGGMGAVEGTAGQQMPYAMIREKSTRTELMTDTSQVDIVVLAVRVYADDLDTASDLGIRLKDLFEGRAFLFHGGWTTKLTRVGDPRHDRAPGYAKGGVPLWYQERSFHCRVRRART